MIAVPITPNCIRTGFMSMKAGDLQHIIPLIDVRWSVSLFNVTVPNHQIPIAMILLD